MTVFPQATLDILAIFQHHAMSSTEYYPLPIVVACQVIFVGISYSGYFPLHKHQQLLQALTQECAKDNPALFCGILQSTWDPKLVSWTFKGYSLASQVPVMWCTPKVVGLVLGNLKSPSTKAPRTLPAWLMFLHKFFFSFTIDNSFSFVLNGLDLSPNQF